ncbi:hypothetical protein U9M48_044371 [Paspalum notatum var. saurae]|uniref:Reverse transcriptase n=1 Tax=Paspalum notatum var. saurae TaxID=547442 RepID=A0AAQ3UWW4_PASNO
MPRPSGCNVTHKRRADGTLDRYKARWVLRGFTQRPGVDCDGTTGPVVKPSAGPCARFSHRLSPAPSLVHPGRT